MKKPAGRYVDIRLTVNMSWESTRNYDYSKLYYRVVRDADFCEEQVICFRVERQGVQQIVRLALPPSVIHAPWVQFRVDVFPYTEGARAQVTNVEVVDDNDSPLSRRADLMARKQWVRQQVAACEQAGKRVVEHLPESLCLEVTPRCNLTCSHCATHGTPEAHEAHNQMPEIPESFLSQLAENVFPSLTSVTAIGRGEPLYLSDQTWDSLVGKLQRNHVLFSIVTNGVLIKKRISPDIIAMIDTLTVSIDGLEQDTFGANRGHANLEKILSNVRYFHETRKALNLPRRPKLCISWTMKRNNIHELLDFLEVIKEFEPDIMFTRHLMIFHEYDVEQSLINHPDICNPVLEKVYKRMKELGIKTECPPLSEQALIPPPPKAHTDAKPTAPNPAPTEPVLQADPCMFIYRTANIHTDGRIHVCPRPNAPYVGSFHEEPFEGIWNGKSYARVRQSLDTDNELQECRDCWYRESRYHPQRFQRDTVNAQNFSVLDPVRFTERAWDFRRRYINIVKLD
jgi:radical SAM protein with 4Fe4S-binding SPASM domain